MQALALKDEAISLINVMPESKIRTVIQFARFINQQNEDDDFRKERDARDLVLLNAHADSMNALVEENLDFQAAVLNW